MLSSADRRMLVGSYAPEDGPGISAFAVDDTAARLRLEKTFTGIRNPSFLAVHPAGNHLFAVSETGLSSDGAHGAVHAFRIEREQGLFDLVPLNQRSTGGDHPCHLHIDAGGHWLAVSNYGSGDVAVFPIEPDGRLGEMAASARHSGSGPRPDRQEAPHAHSAIFAADGRFLLVADLGIDQIVVYAFVAADGSLVRHGDVATSPGAGPRHMVFHPDGSHLMVVNELDSTVSLYRYDARAGSLSELQTFSTVPTDVSQNTAADIQISPLGRHIYVSNRGHNTVAVFAFDPEHGLNRTAVRSSGGEWPRGLGLAPGGRHLVAANRYSDDVVVLPLLAGGSDIGKPIARAMAAQPSCIAFV
jgi:6-phosphogluconolactonase